jgi:hypothetical protein
MPTSPLSRKNKVGKSEMFLAATQRRFSHHVLPAIHHVLTIKKPHLTTCFFQTPLKNTSKNARIPRRRQRGIFF